MKNHLYDYIEVNIEGNNEICNSACISLHFVQFLFK